MGDSGRKNGLLFCGRVITENIFFAEGDKVVLGKVFEFWFRGFKRKDLPDKFIGRSLGNSGPYPAAQVSELDDAAGFNQDRSRVLQSSVMFLLIKQDDAFSWFSFLQIWSNNLSHWSLLSL